MILVAIISEEGLDSLLVHFSLIARVPCSIGPQDDTDLLILSLKLLINFLLKVDSN